MEFLGLPPPGGETNIREDMDTVTAQVFYSIGFLDALASLDFTLVSK